MNAILLLTILFAAAVAGAALISRFTTPASGPHSEQEKSLRREAAIRSAERNRKAMQWVASVVLCLLAVVAVLSWFARDPASKEFGLILSGALALPFLALWAKTRDDGLNPQLRNRREPPSAPTPPPARSSGERR